MKKPSYVIMNKQNWCSYVRQPSQLDLVEFFENIMNEYEKMKKDVFLRQLKSYERLHMSPDSSKDENEDIVIIIEKGERKESCFVEAKSFSVIRTSKVGRYNLYKVAIFYQGDINNALLYENKSGVQIFGEGYIYFYMMDLEYDGIYHFFQLFEIKLAQEFLEFNLMRKLILETYFFKYHIDNYYSNRNNHNRSFQPSSFMHNPTIIPKTPKNAISDISL
ncbi:11790_t:CDS:2, partial [Diversispora eburnea]